MHLLTDGKSRPLRFILTGGHSADIFSAPAMIEGMKVQAVVADKSHDTRTFRDLISSKRMRVAIPLRSHRKREIPHNRREHRRRNVIERCFNKLKHFRRIATRYDRSGGHFLSLLHLASIMIWLL